MPQNKIFFHDYYQSSNQIPDLSLHISLPNSAPSSICTEGDSSQFDIWRPDTDGGAFKSHSDSSIRCSPHTDTQLSLANNLTTPSEAESPWRRNFVSSVREEVKTNHGVSVSEGVIRPFNGIPLYNSSSSNFSSLDKTTSIERNNTKQFSPYAVPYNPSNGSANSVFNSNGVGGTVEPISRFNGITMECLRPHQQFQYLNHQQHQLQQLGIGASDNFANGFVRSRMLPRLQTKRNMRAPRMRWTSSLHARFVHAVELLGGHESESPLSLSQFHCLLFFFFCSDDVSRDFVNPNPKLRIWIPVFVTSMHSIIFTDRCI